MIDYEQTIISQYSGSPTITALLRSYAQAVDPTANLDMFFEMVWDVTTAQGYGLDVWGRIVGVGRVLLVANDFVFGFNEATPGAYPFNEGVFYNGGPAEANYALSDNAYRLLILAKAAANISDGSSASINQILLALFPGRGNCYVVDGLDMTMTYTFEFTLTAVELAIVVQSGALPRPAGVEMLVVSA